MSLRRTFLSIALALTLSFIVAGCSSDSDDPAAPGPTPADFSGNWTLDYEVIAKQICIREIGATGSGTVIIAQDGTKATIVIDAILIDLTVNGTNATGSHVGSPNVDVALTIADGELGGTISFTDTTEPCTEVLAVTGTRDNDPPSSDFQGDWDLNVTVTSSGCEGETVGSMEQICRRINVNGNTVSIEDEDGLIAGVGDGITATLFRIEEDGRLEVTLTVSGSSLEGSIRFFDEQNECQVISSLVGTKRTEPCPPPPPVGDFEGSWDMAITVSASNCPDETVGSAFVACMTASVDGTDIELSDGSSEGPITGTIDGDTALLSRTSQEGVLTISIELDGNIVSGTATMNYTSGNCSGATVVYTLVGNRRSSPCGSSSGDDFGGFWNLTGEITSDTCGVIYQPSCSQFLQTGNTVTIPGDGLQGTVSGNTLTVHEVEVIGTTTVTIHIEMVLSSDKNSMTGTQSLSFADEENPEENCLATANVAGTRTSSCNPASPGMLGMLSREDR